MTKKIRYKTRAQSKKVVSKTFTNILKTLLITFWAHFLIEKLDQIYVEGQGMSTSTNTCSPSYSPQNLRIRLDIYAGTLPEPSTLIDLTSEFDYNAIDSQCQSSVYSWTLHVNSATIWPLELNPKVSQPNAQEPIFAVKRSFMWDTFKVVFKQTVSGGTINEVSVEFDPFSSDFNTDCFGETTSGNFVDKKNDFLAANPALDPWVQFHANHYPGMRCYCTNYYYCPYVSQWDYKWGTGAKYYELSLPDATQNFQKHPLESSYRDVTTNAQTYVTFRTTTSIQNDVSVRDKLWDANLASPYATFTFNPTTYTYTMTVDRDASALATFRANYQIINPIESVVQHSEFVPIIESAPFKHYICDLTGDLSSPQLITKVSSDSTFQQHFAFGDGKNHSFCLSSLKYEWVNPFDLLITTESDHANGPFVMADPSQWPEAELDKDFDLTLNIFRYDFVKSSTEPIHSITVRVRANSQCFNWVKANLALPAQPFKIGPLGSQTNSDLIEVVYDPAVNNVQFEIDYTHNDIDCGVPTFTIKEAQSRIYIMSPNLMQVDASNSSGLTRSSKNEFLFTLVVTNSGSLVQEQAFTLHIFDCGSDLTLAINTDPANLDASYQLMIQDEQPQIRVAIQNISPTDIYTQCWADQTLSVTKNSGGGNWSQISIVNPFSVDKSDQAEIVLVVAYQVLGKVVQKDLAGEYEVLATWNQGKYWRKLKLYLCYADKEQDMLALNQRVLYSSQEQQMLIKLAKFKVFPLNASYCPTYTTSQSTSMYYLPMQIVINFHSILATATMVDPMIDQEMSEDLSSLLFPSDFQQTYTRGIVFSGIGSWIYPDISNGFNQEFTLTITKCEPTETISNENEETGAWVTKLNQNIYTNYFYHNVFQSSTYIFKPFQRSCLGMENSNIEYQVQPYYAGKSTSFPINFNIQSMNQLRPFEVTFNKWSGASGATGFCSEATEIECKILVQITATAPGISVPFVTNFTVQIVNCNLLPSVKTSFIIPDIKMSVPGPSAIINVNSLQMTDDQRCSQFHQVDVQVSDNQNLESVFQPFTEDLINQNSLVQSIQRSECTQTLTCQQSIFKLHPKVEMIKYLTFLVRSTQQGNVLYYSHTIKVTVTKDNRIEETLASGPIPSKKLKQINVNAGQSHTVLLGSFYDPNDQKVFLESYRIVDSVIGQYSWVKIDIDLKTPQIDLDVYFTIDPPITLPKITEIKIELVLKSLVESDEQGQNQQNLASDTSNYLIKVVITNQKAKVKDEFKKEEQEIEDKNESILINSTLLSEQGIDLDMNQVLEKYYEKSEGEKFNIYDFKWKPKQKNTAVTLGPEFSLDIPIQTTTFGQFSLKFNKFAKMSPQIRQWNSKGEGKETIKIVYIPNKETQKFAGESVDLKVELLDWQLQSIESNESEYEKKLAEQRKLSGQNYKQERVNLEVNQINIQMNFTHPNLVSAPVNSQDLLIIQINESLFNEDEDFLAAYKNLNQDLLFDHMIPKQMSQADQLIVETTQQTVKMGLQTFFASNIVLSIFMGGVLQYLWGLVNTLQIIVLTALFSVMIPVNCEEIMFTIMKLTNLDIFRTEDLIVGIFGFRDSDPFSQQFYIAGFESSNFFIELGPALFLSFGFIVFYILKRLLSPIVLDCLGPENILTRLILKPFPLRITVLLFFLEGCIDMGLVALICTLKTRPENFESFWEAISQIMAYICLICLLVAPIYMGYLTNKFLKNPQTEENQQLYNEMFSELSPKSALSLDYSRVFFCRRYLMVLILIMLPLQRNVQIVLQLYSTLFSMCYIAYVRPYLSLKQSLIEILNEWLTLCAAYHLFLFTEFVDDFDRRFEIGYSLIALICFNVLINISLMAIETIKNFKREIRVRYGKLTAKQKIEMKQDRGKKTYEADEKFKKKLTDRIKQTNSLRYLQKLDQIDEVESFSSPISSQVPLRAKTQLTIYGKFNQIQEEQRLHFSHKEEAGIWYSKEFETITQKQREQDRLKAIQPQRYQSMSKLSAQEIQNRKQNSFESRFQKIGFSLDNYQVDKELSEKNPFRDIDLPYNNMKSQDSFGLLTQRGQDENTHKNSTNIEDSWSYSHQKKQSTHALIDLKTSNKQKVTVETFEEKIARLSNIVKKM